MEAEILECCGIKASTANQTNRYIDCFKSKNFFKKNTSDGRKIKKEILLITLCSQCKHYILKYLWYTKKSARFHDWDESKDITGQKADEIFNRRIDDYILFELPKLQNNDRRIKHSKKMPWIYYKSENDTEQIPRYLDESENAGKKIYTPVVLTTLCS